MEEDEEGRNITTLTNTWMSRQDLLQSTYLYYKPAVSRRGTKTSSKHADEDEDEPDSEQDEQVADDSSVSDTRTSRTGTAVALT